MSFYISKPENPSYLSNGAKDFFTENYSHFMASEKLISKHPLSLKTLQIEPVFMPTITGECLEAILNFEVNPDDVFICALPKCGSSWLSTIAWLLTHNLDYKTIESNDRYKLMSNFDDIAIAKAAKERAQELLIIESISKSLSKDEALTKAWNEIFNRFESPRIMKSHHPCHFLPKGIWSKGGRVIYVIRNVKDMAVSLYYFVRNFFHAEFTMDDIVDSIANDLSFYSPLPNHIHNFWKIRYLPNVLFLTYEELVNNPFVSIKRISKFLKCEYSDEQLMELTEYISFKSMKNNKAINRESDIAKMEAVHGRKRPDAGFT